MKCEASYAGYLTTLPSPRTYIRACISAHLSITFVPRTSDPIRDLCQTELVYSIRTWGPHRLTRANEAPRYTKPKISLKSGSSFVMPCLDKNFTADFFTSYGHSVNQKAEGKRGVVTLTALFKVSNCSLLRPSTFPFPLLFPDEGGVDVEPNTSSGTRKLALLPRLFTLPALWRVFVVSFPRLTDEFSISGSTSFELDVRCDFPAFFPNITNGGFRGVGSSGLGSLITGGGMEGTGTTLLATNDSSGGVIEGPAEVHAT